MQAGLATRPIQTDAAKSAAWRGCLQLPIRFPFCRPRILQVGPSTFRKRERLVIARAPPSFGFEDARFSILASVPWDHSLARTCFCASSKFAWSLESRPSEGCGSRCLLRSDVRVLAEP